ncbi:DUF2924 domain-containing protein [Phenylobacterium sp.]|uniref:DUF2924 domain-containing protein n=1 Tax=Phenylobacterium sp. TaxID=1871053 RepID=UPI0035647C00
MNPTALTQEVQALDRLDLEGLREVWRARYNEPPPLRSVDLLRLILAWRIQAQALGGLDPKVRRQLKRRGALEAEGLSLGVGALLKREWQGGVVEVEVMQDGFRWEGRVYRSLSAVATAIAGVKWNGPRFFGLRADAK